MTAASVIAIATASGAASVVVAESADSRAQAAAASVSAPVHSDAGGSTPLAGGKSHVSDSDLRTASVQCPSARKAITFYSRRLNEHRSRMGAPAQRLPARSLTGCPRFLASVLQRKAYATRLRVERWIAQHVLDDFRVTDGARAWHRAVQEAQQPYPGTAAWLLSCSASEGGWGRWVPNSQGAPPGGWMQMYHSTFVRMFSAAKVDVARRGFIVPYSASSWYSPLGQALASAWGLKNGRRGEWSGSGC